MSHIPAVGLGPGEVGVWRARLDPPAAVADALVALCSADERAGLARVPREQDRRDRLVARGVLRLVLARVLGVPANDVAIARPRHGPPRLVSADPAASRLRFSLSHAGRIALLAVGRPDPPDRDAGLGVDVECCDVRLDLDVVTRRVFTRHEHRCVHDLAGDEAREAFFGIWTRKEAYLKAVGTGWTVTPDRLPDLARPRTAGACRVRDVPVPPGYAAAVAVTPPTAAWRPPTVHDLDTGQLLAVSARATAARPLVTVRPTHP